MMCYARWLWAFSALCIAILHCGIAPGVETVVRDSDYFGIRGSIDEGTALIGQRAGGPTGNGDVQVFDAEGADWTRTVSFSDLLPSGCLSQSANFGAGALVIDGDTALAAAYGNEVDGVSQAGSVFLFSRSEGTWSYDGEWTEMLPPGATAPVASAQFGIDGDLSGDQAIVIASGTNNAYIYDRSGGAWDTGTLLEGGSLDTPIAAAIDQQVAVVGTFLGAGHVDVWRYDGQTWNHEDEVANPESGNLFASDVDVSGDTLVVSAYTEALAETARAGAVHVYQFDEGAGEWLWQQTIANPEPATDAAFGYSVAIEGDRLVIGAPREDDGDLVDTGAAYVYERVDSTWTQVDKRVLDDSITGLPVAGQWFGESVSIGEVSLLAGGSGRSVQDAVGNGVVMLDGPVKVFIPGDANRDGVVNEADAAILAENWGSTSDGWAAGDFNDDGAVNAADAAMLAANWHVGTTESGTSVPEPTGIALLIGVLLASLGMRRRGV